jgi:predicted nucleic acid-binding protein
LTQGKKPTKPRKEGLVIDSSISIAWCFPDEQDEYSQAVLDALTSERACVPDHWHLEVANTLLVGERRKRSTQANTVTWLGFLAALPIVVDEESSAHAFGNTLSLARDHGLSAYDAAYLELAMRRGLPLATLDDKLKTAAAAAGVPLFAVQSGRARIRPRRPRREAMPTAVDR